MFGAERSLTLQMEQEYIILIAIKMFPFKYQLLATATPQWFVNGT